MPLRCDVSPSLRSSSVLAERPADRRRLGGYQVEALFDNAGFAVPGEEVRIAGAPVGTISALSVTKQNLAAVTLSITNRDFTPWLRQRHLHDPAAVADRRALRRLLSRAPRATRRLRRITRGYGAGSYLLPVTQTSSPIDPDIVQNISQDSVRESLSVILNELGTGLAARGSDLNAVILRADPALAQTERVFKMLASQNKVLAKLATDSDTVLAPLAKTRQLARRLRRAGQHDRHRQRHRSAAAGRSRSSCCRRS